MSMHLNRRHCLRMLGALPLVHSVAAQTPSGERSLVFGMVPYLPVQQLVRLYEPIVALIERTLGRPCVLATAPDFEQFIERARKGEFDIIGASPHVARLLQREEGFSPLARATAALEPLVVVPTESPLKRLQDLSQRAVLVADPFAVHVLIALRDIRDHGVVPGRDVKLVVAGTQRNCVQRMLNGDAPAAVGSASTLTLLPPELSTRFKVLTRCPKGLTPMAYLAHPRWSAQAPKLSQNLLQFPNTPEGQGLLKATQHEGLSALSIAELATADPLVTEYYRQRANTF
ncbi:phosphate/phosphite/phosphonate ABC transporter substrate-binding protein [Rhodoferax aquaticus]|uniref:Phosphate/phosphite/phosphonate ABC transporter substrate-binding protein n=1 Tax=Rhodoferax aquaticus TaxID=2527691 RepID=A0A515ET43_9BURK|nr:phosphate/phosphite/phosphonate ABC transporter substrate-binding protein [Rhodoferax aquaticus]QDL55844.1 phosphate/phosphite/phosphonate ABC transporter substrate-binding protein [Rhodoferax aquaticus]